MQSTKSSSQGVTNQPKPTSWAQASSLQDETGSRYSSGGFVSGMIMTLVCPCVPVAQVASAVGFSLLRNRCACRGHFRQRHVVLSAYAGQIVAFIAGPFVTLVVAFYKYSNERWSSGMGTVVTYVGEINEELNAKMTVSAVSVSLIATMILLNLVFAMGILRLRLLLNRRIKLDTKDDSGCRTTATVLCCASCSLFEMIWTIKNTSKAPPFYLGPIDEIPAFESDVEVVSRGDAAAVA